MNYIKTMNLTTSQAKELSHLGFQVKLVTMLCGEYDKYEVWVC